MLQPGCAAPDFQSQAVYPDGSIKDIKLSQFKGKYVVLLFYPADFTFVCPTEIISFSERAADFQKMGCELLCISCDSVFTHLAWKNTPRERGGLGSINIPMVADKTLHIGKAYGVLKESDGVTFRGLFIIDGLGTLRQITINDLPVGRDVDETLRLVQAFLFTDQHGEVCPASWRPGKKSMKPSPEGVAAYLADQEKQAK